MKILKPLNQSVIKTLKEMGKERSNLNLIRRSADNLFEHPEQKKIFIEVMESTHFASVYRNLGVQAEAAAQKKKPIKFSIFPIINSFKSKKDNYNPTLVLSPFRAKVSSSKLVRFLFNLASARNLSKEGIMENSSVETVTRIPAYIKAEKDLKIFRKQMGRLVRNYYKGVKAEANGLMDNFSGSTYKNMKNRFTYLVNVPSHSIAAIKTKLISQILQPQIQNYSREMFTHPKQAEIFSNVLYSMHLVSRQRAMQNNDIKMIPNIVFHLSKRENHDVNLVFNAVGRKKGVLGYTKALIKNLPIFRNPEEVVRSQSLILKTKQIPVNCTSEEEKASLQEFKGQMGKLARDYYKRMNAEYKKTYTGGQCSPLTHN